MTLLVVEPFHGFCREILLPKLFEQSWSNMLGSCEILTTWIKTHSPLLKKQAFMNKHRIRTLSIPPCWRWVRPLGFRYNYLQKQYCVVGHARRDVEESQDAFCETYFTDVAPRCLRWIHVSQQALETTHEILHPLFGHQQCNDECNQSFKDTGTKLLVYTNPSMSIRAHMPNQEQGLFPKLLLGVGLMTSAFDSRDSGCWMPASESCTVSNHLRYNTEYINKTAALSVQLTEHKAPLPERITVCTKPSHRSNEGLILEQLSCGNPMGGCCRLPTSTYRETWL